MKSHFYNNYFLKEVASTAVKGLKVWIISSNKLRALTPNNLNLLCQNSFKEQKEIYIGTGFNCILDGLKKK